jgi:hypothetical protein
MVQWNPLGRFFKKDTTATIGESSSIAKALTTKAEEAKAALEAANLQVKTAAEAVEKADSLAAKALAREATQKAEVARKAAEKALEKANRAAAKAAELTEKETAAQLALKNLKKGKAAPVAAEAVESAVPPVLNTGPAVVENVAADGLKVTAAAATGAAEAVVIKGAAVKAAKTGFFRGAAETAVNAATHAPKKLFGQLSSVGGAVGKSRVGAFILTGVAMIAAGFGIKSWAEQREARKEEEAMAMVPEAVALRQNILENQARIAQVSEELGAGNRQAANFRENVRSAGMSGPNAGDPAVSPSI